MIFWFSTLYFTFIFLTIKLNENKELVPVLHGLPPPLCKGPFGPPVCVSIEAFISGTPLPPPHGKRHQVFPAELKSGLGILLNTSLQLVRTQ